MANWVEVLNDFDVNQINDSAYLEQFCKRVDESFRPEEFFPDGSKKREYTLEDTFRYIEQHIKDTNPNHLLILAFLQKFAAKKQAEADAEFDSEDFSEAGNFYFGLTANLQFIMAELFQQFLKLQQLPEDQVTRFEVNFALLMERATLGDLQSSLLAKIDLFNVVKEIDVKEAHKSRNPKLPNAEWSYHRYGRSLSDKPALTKVSKGVNPYPPAMNDKKVSHGSGEIAKFNNVVVCGRRLLQSHSEFNEAYQKRVDDMLVRFSTPSVPRRYQNEADDAYQKRVDNRRKHFPSPSLPIENFIRGEITQKGQLPVNASAEDFMKKPGVADRFKLVPHAIVFSKSNAKSDPASVNCRIVHYLYEKNSDDDAVGKPLMVFDTTYQISPPKSKNNQVRIQVLDDYELMLNAKAVQRVLKNPAPKSNGVKDSQSEVTKAPTRPSLLKRAWNYAKNHPKRVIAGVIVGGVVGAVASVFVLPAVAVVIGVGIAAWAGSAHSLSIPSIPPSQAVSDLSQKEVEIAIQAEGNVLKNNQAQSVEQSFEPESEVIIIGGLGQEQEESILQVEADLPQNKKISSSGQQSVEQPFEQEPEVIIIGDSSQGQKGDVVPPEVGPAGNKNEPQKKKNGSIKLSLFSRHIITNGFNDDSRVSKVQEVLDDENKIASPDELQPTPTTGKGIKVR